MGKTVVKIIPKYIRPWLFPRDITCRKYDLHQDIILFDVG